MGRLRGTGEVSGESRARTVSVEYDPALVTVDQIRQALLALGYESSPLGP